MAKMGRPIAEDPKSKRVTIRLNEKEHKALSDYSKEHNQTMTESLKKTFIDKMKEEGKL